jgi:hypothetical protein
MGAKKEAKVGRNDPCRCGSKRKYKKVLLWEDIRLEMSDEPTARGG